jgi:hypothetical protein
VTIKHCGNPIEASVVKDLLPTEDETLRGIVNVTGRVYYCRTCAKRVYHRVDQFKTGEDKLSRVRPGFIGAFSRRLKQAHECQWVWGYHPVLFTKVKRLV